MLCDAVLVKLHTALLNAGQCGIEIHFKAFVQICRRSRAAQLIRKCHESHVSGIGAILILNDPAPSLNAVSRDKKSASVRQADGPTNFSPI